MRGSIEYRERAKQINDFSNLKRMRNITPTDIDGSVDYSGKAFIFMEGKYNGVELKYGQRMHLEYLCKANKYPCIVIVYDHYVQDPLSDVDVASCLCREFYYANPDYKWYIDGQNTVKELFDKFEKKNKIF